jgi:hypothetical protein
MSCGVRRPTSVDRPLKNRGPPRESAGGSRCDGEVTGLGGDAPQPPSDGAEWREIEAAFLRHVRVRVERDIGDGVSLADEEPPRRQVP